MLKGVFEAEMKRYELLTWKCENTPHTSKGKYVVKLKYSHTLIWLRVKSLNSCIKVKG